MTPYSKAKFHKIKKEIKAYIKSNYIGTIIKQLPESYQSSSGIISLSLKLDLTKTLRQNNQIGLFIIGNYPKFIKLVEQSVHQGIVQTKKFTPQYGLNISFSISNCPLPRHNLQSVDFLSAAFEQQHGVLVYLKDAHILKVNQPQLYLSSWQEVWAGFCSCSTERQMMKKQQSLIEIVKSKSQNLREALIFEIPRCSQCNSKLRLMGIQDKYFLNCQLIKIMANMKDNIINNKDEIFQRGQFTILVDENNAQKFQQGDIADMCCYYSTQPKISKINGQQISLKCQSGLFLVCSYPVNPLTSNNNIFFSSLIGITCQYIKCDDPTDEETICYNYKNLIKTINSIKFPYLNDNSLSTLKLIVVNSLFNLAQHVKVHFVIITDQVNLIKQSLKVNGVVIRYWPSLYDHNTLIQFLNTCHNCILMFTNPSKKDFQYINNILNEKIMNNINFTLWVITQPNPELKKDVVIDRFQIVIDLSLQKNIMVCKNVYDSMIDQKLESFLQPTNEIILTVPKGRRTANQQQDFNGQSFQGVECDQQQMQNESKIALKLLERYFVRARQYKTISSSSLENIKHIAEGFAHFRAFLRSKGSQKVKKSPINILDAIIAIFIEEQTSRNKYSSSNTLFSNEISKLMLNEGDCELSFWDYEVDEENDHLNEAKKMIKKDQMFKRMVNKLMILIYNNEVV